MNWSADAPQPVILMHSEHVSAACREDQLRKKIFQGGETDPQTAKVQGCISRFSDQFKKDESEQRWLRLLFFADS